MKIPSLLFLAALLGTGLAGASEHHSGHVGGGGNEAGEPCLKPHLNKFSPAHLETVAPGAEFSFYAMNVPKPEQISVTVKNIPVEINTDFKDPFFVVTGHLPAELHDTYARINIKVKGKFSSCDGENGWLLKISGK